MNEWISRWVGDIDKGISGLRWVNEGMQIWMDECMHAWMDGLVGKDKCSHKKTLQLMYNNRKEMFCAISIEDASVFLTADIHDVQVVFQSRAWITKYVD